MAATTNRAVAKTDNLPPPLITRDQLAVDYVHFSNSIAELEDACKEAPTVAEDDEDLTTITRLATSIIALQKSIETARKAEVQPFLDGETTVNDFLKRELPNRLSKLKAALETTTTAYQRKKAAREQAARVAAADAARKLVEEAAAKVTEAVKASDVRAATVAVTEANSLTAFANKANVAAAAPVNSMAKVSTDAGSASLVDNWTFDDLDMNTVDLETLRAFIPQTAIEQAIRAFIKAGRREIKGARIFNDSKTRFRA
ncbi:hypothetical protein LJR220_003394 [Bradyrhizobium sp. LjRoot220]|uniref:hypothetical protein n=1 Tax=Bradyrhizobium sp. LjRoot220 TaxID=3342284 RepID=UPI003ED0F8A2